MTRVGRRERSHLQHSALHQTLHHPAHLQGGQHLGGHRHAPTHRLQHGSFVPLQSIEPFGPPLGDQHHAVEFARVLVGQLLVEHGVHQFGLGDRQLAHRHHLARAEQQHAAGGAHVVHHPAVAAEAVGVHGHGLHHGAVTAHSGAIGTDVRHATAQYRDVGGGAADVADDRVVETGEVRCPHQAGGGAGEDGLDGSFAHERRRHQ